MACWGCNALADLHVHDMKLVKAGFVPAFTD